jgi:hypothetical protein
MTSEAQIAANRLNARKSTGPRTAKGKAIACRNARKHLSLARTVLISAGELQESHRDFRKMCTYFYKSLLPVGPLEEMLVDQIVTANWRLRRVHKAEVGEIALNLQFDVKSTGETDHVALVYKLATLNPDSDIVAALSATNHGCDIILAALRTALANFQRDNKVSDELLENLVKPFGTSGKCFHDPVCKLIEEMARKPASIDPQVVYDDFARGVVGFFNDQIRHFEQIKAGRTPRLDAAVRARHAAAALPKPDALERILRYETVLQRQIHRATEQLSRLQLQRQSQT